MWNAIVNFFKNFDWVAFHKGLGSIGAAAAVIVPLVPAISAAYPNAAPVIEGIGKIAALTGIIAHQVDDSNAIPTK